MKKLSVTELPLKDKRVFLRVDFNVPLDDNLRITDDTRIRASLATIQFIIDHGGIPIIASHLGRPKGVDPKQSLKPVAVRLAELIQRPVQFAPDCVGPAVKALVFSLKPGDLILLENLRFHPEEEKNDPQFAKELASLADLYVNDAFGASHRAHASIEAIATYFKEPACGFLMEKEIRYLSAALENPKRPFIAIIGGAKISGKIDVINNLKNRVDRLIIGGGMAFTFYRAQGYEIGRSILESDRIEMARALLNEPKIYLPKDCLVAADAKKGSPTRSVRIDAIPPDLIGVDIGPESIREIKEIISKVGTIVWNGPMGIFEIDEYATGTREIAQMVANATLRGAVSIVGGGDTVSALAKFKLLHRVSHASTGGGASLEFLEGKTLPGIKVLKDV
ncbi:MAG: phosphoglycerate kinase [candidate division WOR-3 bacterium]